MIRYAPYQDVTRSDADLLVNTVNTVGVMGKGVALAFKKRFPQIMEKYQKACSEGRLSVGAFQITKINQSQHVINLATKEHWTNPSKYEWVGSGLVYLNKYITDQPGRFSSLCMPMPGAGNGGLDPARVQQMLRIYMAPAVSDGLDLTLCAAEEAPIKDPVFFAGIGARKTPEETLMVMRDVGAMLSERDIFLRSGGAAGADSAFHEGAKEVGAGNEIYLPFPNPKIPDGICNSSPVFDRLARNFHPNPSSLTPDANDKTDRRHKTLRLMSRNGHQVFGVDFQNPSHLVICWTPGGEGGGGTGQAIRLARSVGIPVIDLGRPEFRGISAPDVVDMAQDAIANFQISRGIKLDALGEDHSPSL